MAEMRRKDRGKAGVVVFRQPHRIDIELSVAGEHGVERGKVPKRLFHDLRTGLNEDAVNCGGDVQKFIPAPW